MVEKKEINSSVGDKSIEELNRRVRLAQDRTHLANERTLLSYWRTSTAFLALGAFLIRFVTSADFITLGLLAIIFGVFLFFYGIVGYFIHKQTIKNI